jgi:hypothetical protein
MPNPMAVSKVGWDRLEGDQRGQPDDREAGERAQLLRLPDGRDNRLGRGDMHADVEIASRA